MLDAGAAYLHLDVMDGHFVPNLTFGAPVISCLRKNIAPNVILDVHLMVTDPGKWIDDMAAAGANIFTFHTEVSNDNDTIKSIIEKIKSKGMKVGLAIKPNTPVEILFPFLDIIDQALVMTVEPGFGGQKFMHDMMPKVSILRQRCPNMNIQVDGGLALDTIDIASKAGANMIVAGSAVFKGSPIDVISQMKSSINKYGNGR